MQAGELRALLQRPIAFHRIFATVAGGAGPGLFLSQAFYWTQRTNDPDGWFWKTQEEWEAETGLTRYEQETARARCRSAGLLLEKRTRIPPRLYYKVDMDRLAAACTEAALRNVENPHYVPLETDTTEGRKPPVRNVEKRPSLTIAETTHRLPETSGKGRRRPATLFEYIIASCTAVVGELNPGQVEYVKQRIEEIGGLEKLNTGMSDYAKDESLTNATKRNLKYYFRVIARCAENPDTYREPPTWTDGGGPGRQTLQRGVAGSLADPAVAEKYTTGKYAGIFGNNKKE